MEFFGIIYLFFVLVEICVGQNLVAVEANAKLPNHSQDHVAIYDGGKSILILGGWNGHAFVDEIYSYHLEQDTISLIANFPNGLSNGLATFDKKGNVYYMGGRASGYSYDIFKLDVKRDNLSLVGQLSEYHAYGTAINSNTDENKTMLFSGKKEAVTCLDLNTLATCCRKSLLGTYPYDLAALEHNGYAYVFGDSMNYSIEKIDLESMESEVIEGFGFQLYYPAVISDGTFGYIIGGYFAFTAGIPVDGIIRYDPQTNEHTFLQVDNFPVNGGDRCSHGAAVYVENLDRIYMIGGNLILDDKGRQDKIWYIELHPSREEPPSTLIPISTTTMNPDIFNCDKRPNGMYPHPYDCGKFIGCRYEILEVYECPPPLLFNPITLSCAFAEDVECSINCSGKPNGFYPHPHSCELFIGCHDELVEVYKCPAPLMFHPEERKCTFPEDVSCNIK